TSGVLSFAEADLAAEVKHKLMDSFERALLPGLDADQYSVLWVEHRDKGRLELNFVVPNIELQRGKRLQPYFDRADRPRIDAWQTVVNARLGLHDPNDPLNQRALVTPNCLPRDKQAAAEAITNGLLMRIEAGEIRGRADVVETLETAGFSVVRQTKQSISIASPEGGQNLRLKGAIYEESFRFGEGLRAEIERASEHYRGESRTRVQSARERYQHGVALKRAENQQRYPRAERGFALDGVEDMAFRRGGAARDAVSERERAVVARDTDTRQPAVDSRTV
ncbi:TPA: relaxase/mobilization nuclease domain-containing protein, partial [Escherichia coli]|nr:relaxase/mobilization nuclease domain-containing protein [Escherichia coli]